MQGYRVVDPMLDYTSVSATGEEDADEKEDVIELRRNAIGLLVRRALSRADGVYGQRGNVFVTSRDAHELKLIISHRRFMGSLFDISYNLVQGCSVPQMYWVSAEASIILSLKIFSSLIVARSRIVFDFIAALLTRPFESQAITPSTTLGYTAEIDLCLKASKDPYGHPRASEESTRVSKHPEGKRALKIYSGVCDLVWVAIASGLFTFTAGRVELSRSVVLVDWLSYGQCKVGRVYFVINTVTYINSEPLPSP
ncbi:hypothetical protein RF11_13589 [Thelohanellus kitauei]|uniref:Uncharacterized protein n=1 Tax=Thelohanellus kitauei TaxID=669202 RepID=A0A0C2N9K4_THEKT|nr:hypothetical protein RF11_07401 [Thelohanellus kitauei]KII73030.1 hypothetical protein RF11_13589 [Thelohanellus kitauei]